MEIEKAKGKSMEEIARSVGVHAVTLAKWKREYGGLQLDQAKRLKELEKENGRLKRLFADQALDNAIMKEALTGNY
jgi:putative transposase